ncbi:hypothetical protein [Photobacterium indicum]|uniref:Uncharacterized protein n=1 Tax=Photobacterium indicum TaxID=81447 RepID=A0A2T3LEM0_9GAMM|nr:hypothetical protein [Photobacterium indicum]PSV49830.1 hypothetical protein C9J47_04560 [Photobacterium indicum]
MLDKIESALDKFNASATEAKAVVEKTQSLDLSTKQLEPMLDLLDERIENASRKLKREILVTIDEAHAKQKKEMELRFKAERSHEKKVLLINVGIASMAVVTFIFQRVLG